MTEPAAKRARLSMKDVLLTMEARLSPYSPPGRGGQTLSTLPHSHHVGRRGQTIYTLSALVPSHLHSGSVCVLCVCVLCVCVLCVCVLCMSVCEYVSSLGLNKFFF